MKLLSKIVLSSICVLVAANSHGQAIDSTGIDKLIGVSTRVEAAIPAAIPGPAGAQGAAGQKGDTGAPGGVQQGSTCGIATLERNFYDGAEDRAYRFNLVSSCMGYRVAYNVSRTTYNECPPGFTTGVLSTTGRITAIGESTSNQHIYETWTCFKT